MTASLNVYVLTTPEDFAASGRTEQFGQGMASVPDSDGSLAKLLRKELGHHFEIVCVEGDLWCFVPGSPHWQPLPKVVLSRCLLRLDGRSVAGSNHKVLKISAGKVASIVQLLRALATPPNNEDFFTVPAGRRRGRPRPSTCRQTSDRWRA